MHLTPKKMDVQINFVWSPQGEAETGDRGTGKARVTKGEQKEEQSWRRRHRAERT